MSNPITDKIVKTREEWEAEAEELEFWAELREATQKRNEAEASWREAIRNAYDKGCSLREIAYVAGVSHERVRGIVTR